MFKNIAKNFLSLITAQMIYKALSFAAIVYVARMIGDVKFGQLSLALYLGSLFFAVSDMGMSEGYVCEVAGNMAEEFKIIGINIGNRLMLGAVAMALSFVTAFMFASDPSVISLIILISLSMILDSFTFFLRSVFRAREKMRYEAVSFILEAVIKFITVIGAVILFKDNLILLGAAFLITSLIIFISAVIFCVKKGILLKPLIRIKLSANLMKRCLPFAVIGFLCGISFKIDVFMLSKLADDAVTGWYSAGARLIEAVLIIPATVAIIFFPVISRLYKDSKDLFIKMYGNFSAACIILSIPAALFLYLGADLLVSFMFGAGFIKAVFVVKLLSFVLILFFLKFFLEKAVLVMQGQTILFTAYLGGIVLKIGLNFIFIPLFSCNGAALSTLFTELCVVAYIVLKIKTRLLLLKEGRLV